MSKKILLSLSLLLLSYISDAQLVASYSGFSGGEIAIAKLGCPRELIVTSGNDTLNVVGFFVEVTNGPYTKGSISMSGFITAQQRSLLGSVKIGSRIYFSSIRAIQDHKQVDVPSFELKVVGN